MDSVSPANMYLDEGPDYHRNGHCSGIDIFQGIMSRFSLMLRADITTGCSHWEFPSIWLHEASSLLHCQIVLACLVLLLQAYHPLLYSKLLDLFTQKFHPLLHWQKIDFPIFGFWYCTYIWQGTISIQRSAILWVLMFIEVRDHWMTSSNPSYNLDSACMKKAIVDIRLHPWCCPWWVISSMQPVHIAFTLQIMWNHDVMHNTGSPLSSEEDWATATGNMHRKFGEVQGQCQDFLTG